jgi:sugar lactone lactonase YvrE
MCRGITALNSLTTRYRSIVPVFGLLAFVSILIACSNALQSGKGAQSGSAATAKSASVDVALGGLGPSAAKSLIGDSAVASVKILAYDAGSGAAVGSGSLTKGTSYWNGNITVSETGSVLFEAAAYTSAGSLDYCGEMTATLTGKGDKVSIGVLAASLYAGSIHGNVPSLSPVVSTFAGSTAGFSLPTDVATDGTNLYVADSNHNEIRKIAISTGAVTTLAGSTQSGHLDGTGAGATFNGPYAVTTDGMSLYVADSLNNEIRKIVIATGEVSTLAGSPPPALSGNTNGTGTNAKFDDPDGIATDGTNLYVADYNNNEIRKIVISTRAVTTLVGAAAGLNGPGGIATDGTSLYVADSSNNEIRKILISTGAVTTLAGSISGGHTDGTGTAASFTGPQGITTDGANLYVADCLNNEIRKIVIATGAVTTLAGSYKSSGSSDGKGTAAKFNGPNGITTDGTNLYVADYSNNEIRRIQ